MKYAIVDADKAEEMGIDLALHRVDDGKVVLNENELAMLGRKYEASNLEMAAKMGGTELLGRSAVRLATMRWKDKQ